MASSWLCGALASRPTRPATPRPACALRRSKFVAPGTSIHYYVVEFDPAKLAWADFRAKVLGPTDPKDAPPGSLRATIFKDWKVRPPAACVCVRASWTCALA